MASRRDELDAYTCARRRVVAAFLLGRSVADEQDAPRPVRAFLASLVLGAVLLAGSGLLGKVRQDTAPNGWQQAIAQDRDTGGRYIVGDQHRLLHPVVNLVSAMLARPAGARIVIVPHQTLLGQQQGVPVGIRDAPDLPPDPLDARHPPAWTLCQPSGPGPGPGPGSESGPGTLLVGPARNGDPLSPDTAALVVDPAGVRWLIVDGRRLRVADEAALRALLAKDGPAPAPLPVSQNWLSPMPQGESVDLIRLPGLGLPSPGARLPAALDRVGTVVNGDGGKVFVVTQRGLAEVSEAQVQVLKADPASPAASQPGRPSLADYPGVNAAAFADPLDRPGWPAATRPAARVSAGHALCVAVGRSGVALSVAVTAELPTGLGRALDGTMVAVLAGGATVARVGGGFWLVDRAGWRYQVFPAGNAPAPATRMAEALARLGVTRDGADGGVAPSVPRDWLELLPPGPALDPSQAGAPARFR